MKEESDYKIIFTYKTTEGYQVRVAVPTGAGLQETIEAFKGFLMATTFHPDTIKEYFGGEE